jgi:SOS response regulatory protein OraA/RecX
VNVSDLLISQPDTGEQALEIADMLVRSGGIDVVVIDSVAALTPRAEIEGEMGDQLPGLQARLMSQALRKLTANIKRTNTLVIFINQIRMKIGVMFGNPETTTGGNALKFYASVRLDIRRTGSIKKGEEVVGSETASRWSRTRWRRPSARPSSTSSTARASRARARSSSSACCTSWSRSPAPGTPTTASASARARTTPASTSRSTRDGARDREQGARRRRRGRAAGRRRGRGLSDALKGKALRLLARREHSRAELARKLAAEAERRKRSRSVLDQLEQAGLLSDARFAEALVFSRAARFGAARLRHDLRARASPRKSSPAVLPPMPEPRKSRGRARSGGASSARRPPTAPTTRARRASCKQRGFATDVIRKVLKEQQE